jgi:hypothetical protein
MSVLVLSIGVAPDVWEEGWWVVTT